MTSLGLFKQFCNAIGVIALALSFAVLTHADSDGVAQVTGRVTDPNHAPIAGAQVTISSSDGSVVRSTVTNAQGEFVLVVGVAEYSIKVTAAGFADSVRQGVASNGASIEIVMSVSGANVSVNVEDVPEYVTPAVSSATKTLTPLRDVPQAVAVVTKEQMQDQLLTSIGDILRYTPGVTVHQGENNRDEAIIRGQDTSSSFFLNGVRDDVQYYRDPYNLERLETLKGPNAMIFGRGGGGGVINRVTKEANFAALRQFEVQGGSFWNRRVSGDIDQLLNDKFAFRLNGVYENSDSFRKFVNLNRVAFNPTLTFKPSEDTKFTISYEFARDRRRADRGITSFNNLPADVPIDTYYGNPDQAFVRSNVNLVSGTFEQQLGKLNIHNRTTYGDYDRMYQNFVPGTAVVPVGSTTPTLVNLTGYNNATKRKNLFSQTDLTYILNTGSIKHTIVGGVDLGNQRSDNFRNTAFFNNTTTSIQVDFNNPTTSIPATFRQSATDADNHVGVALGASYIQDQAQLNRFVTVVAGLRYDYFDLKFHNNRDSSNFRRIDNLISPRVGLVVKPVQALSVYGNYSVSHLPSSGDQFSSLTNITAQLEPEKFTNYEVGIKWDIRRNLMLTSALFRLDRTNTRSIDPNNAQAIIQTGGQRTNGFEFGLSGLVLPRWMISGGYSYQDAFITSATASAKQGFLVGQTPHHTFSVWNKYQLLRKLDVGLGIISRSDMFVAVDNAVVLPGYIRADAGVFYQLNEHWRVQANVENLFDKRYIINADSNTNLSPGSSRAFKMGLVARF
ncbi:MAG: TonB-dependent siderophore receptor [Acidobacteriota bacterium]